MTHWTARRRLRTAVVGASALALGLGAVAATGSAQATGKHRGGFGSDNPAVVIAGLDNPRQLAVGHHGSLLAAISGRGGTECQGTGEEEQCIGATSGIGKLLHPGAKRPKARVVVGGLPSAAGPDGSFAGGVSGVSVSRLGTFGVGAAPPELGSPTGGLAGKLFVVKKGKAVPVADLAAYEAAKDPDGQGVESNPYSVLAQDRRVLVADAAGNSIVAVDKRGKISTFHVFGNITTGDCAGRPNDAGTTGCDFVPTSLAQGPHGTVYVTGLASEAEGEGRVVVLSARGKKLAEWSGFSSPVGVAVKKHGEFYVSELLVGFNPADPEFDPSTVGQVTKVKWNQRVSRQVPFPAGIAIVRGKLYVAAWSIAPSTGAFGNPDWTGRILRMSL